jgi:hypothetical protein
VPHGWGLKLLVFTFTTVLSFVIGSAAIAHAYNGDFQVTYSGETIDEQADTDLCNFWCKALYGSTTRAFNQDNGVGTTASSLRENAGAAEIGSVGCVIIHLALL